jgi:hypothetical protein
MSIFSTTSLSPTLRAAALEQTSELDREPLAIVYSSPHLSSELLGGLPLCCASLLSVRKASFDRGSQVSSEAARRVGLNEVVEISCSNLINTNQIDSVLVPISG